MYTYTERMDTAVKYTVITPAGRVYTFYLLAAAEVWHAAYGGVLIKSDVLEPCHA